MYYIGHYLKAKNFGLAREPLIDPVHHQHQPMTKTWLDGNSAAHGPNTSSSNETWSWFPFCALILDNQTKRISNPHLESNIFLIDLSKTYIVDKCRYSSIRTVHNFLAIHPRALKFWKRLPKQTAGCSFGRWKATAKSKPDKPFTIFDRHVLWTRIPSQMSFR